MGSAVGLIVDTETTGLTDADEVIEVGLLLFEYDVETGRLLGLVDRYVGMREPSLASSEAAFAAHRISPEMCRGQLLDKFKIRTLFSRAGVIFAHNAQFDRRFMHRFDPELPDRPWACTMSQIRWRQEGQASASLDAIAERYGFRRPQPHRALQDAIAVLSVLRRPNVAGVPHIKHLHDRAVRGPLQIQFRLATGEPIDLFVFNVDEDELLASGLGTQAVLWTKPHLPFINAYIRGTLMGLGCVIQMLKSKNSDLAEIVEAGPEVQLELVSIQGRSLMVEVTQRE